VASILVAVAFLADAVFGFLGNTALAPFGAANLLMDIVYVIMGGILAFMSFKTWKEQR
jgi:uncharacterized membrane protein